MSATPTPVSTSPSTVPVSPARKTTSGRTPVASRSEIAWSALRQSFRQTSGSAASSSSDGGRATAASERVRAHDEHVRVAQERHGLEGPVRQGQDRERQVELAGVQQLEQRRVGDRLDEVEAEIRAIAEELAQDRRQHQRSGALVDAHAQPSSLPLGVGREIRVSGRQLAEDRPCVAQQDQPRLGRLDAVPAAAAVDEPLADDALERGDLLADRRLRVAELVGGAVEGGLVGDSQKRREMPELDSEPGQNRSLPGPPRLARRSPMPER